MAACAGVESNKSPIYNKVCVNGRFCNVSESLSYLGHDPFNQNSNRSDREKWSTSKGGPVFSKLFRLDRTDLLSFGPKFPEILVEWIAPLVDQRYSGKKSKRPATLCHR